MSLLIDTFANRLKYAITIKDIKPIELSRKTGISKTNISCYMSGKYEAKQDKLHALAQVLNVDEGWLMGYDVKQERKVTSETNLPKQYGQPVLCLVLSAIFINHSCPFEHFHLAFFLLALATSSKLIFFLLSTSPVHSLINCNPNSPLSKHHVLRSLTPF